MEDYCSSQILTLQPYKAAEFTRSHQNPCCQASSRALSCAEPLWFRQNTRTTGSYGRGLRGTTASDCLKTTMVAPKEVSIDAAQASVVSELETDRRKGFSQ